MDEVLSFLDLSEISEFRILRSPVRVKIPQGAPDEALTSNLYRTVVEEVEVGESVGQRICGRHRVLKA